MPLSPEDLKLLGEVRAWNNGATLKRLIGMIDTLQADNLYLTRLCFNVLKSSEAMGPDDRAAIISTLEIRIAPSTM